MRGPLVDRSSESVDASPAPSDGFLATLPAAVAPARSRPAAAPGSPGPRAPPGKPAAAVAFTAVLSVAGVAAANDWLPVFRTEQVALVAFDSADLVALPDLSATAPSR